MGWDPGCEMGFGFGGLQQRGWDSGWEDGVQVRLGGGCLAPSLSSPDPVLSVLAPAPPLWPGSGENPKTTPADL